MSTQLQEICQCCGDPIKGTPYVDAAVGIVDAQCMHALRDAAKKLDKAGMKNLHLGDCPDLQNEKP